MNVTYTEKARQDSEQFVLLQKATKRLEEALEESAEHVTASWDRIEDDKGRTFFVLHLKDPTDEITGQFALDDLQSPGQTSFRIHRLWGNLLLNREKREIKKLRELIGTGG